MPIQGTTAKNQNDTIIVQAGHAYTHPVAVSTIAHLWKFLRG